MRRSKLTIAVLVLGSGLLSAYLSAPAQEYKPPWPPPPVKPRPQAGPVASKSPLPSGQRIGVGQIIIPVRAEERAEKSEPPPPMFPDPIPSVTPLDTVPTTPAGPDLKTVPAQAGTEPGKMPAPLPTIQDSPPLQTGPSPTLPEVQAPPKPLPPPRNDTPPDLPAAPKVAPIPVKTSPGPAVIDVPGHSALPEPGTPSGLPPPPDIPEPPARPIVPIRRRGHEPDPPPAQNISRSVNIPEASPAPRLDAPMLTVEKRGPASVVLGQPVHYEIVVRNVGSQAVPQARVEDLLPDNVRFLKGSPAPNVQGKRISWNLQTLLPGAEQRLQLELQPTAAGDMPSRTSLVLTVGSNTQVTTPPLALTVHGPGRVPTGKQAVFEVMLSNNTDRRLVNLILNAQLSAGLQHPTGQSIDANIGTLEAGASKSLKLVASTVEPGPQGIDFRVLLDEREEARARGSVFVGESGLLLHLPASTRVLLDRTAEIAIELGNFHGKIARNVVVTATLPEGLEFLGANERGLYRGSPRTVQWVFDYLAVDQTKNLIVRVQGKKTGEAVMPVSATGANGLKARTKTLTLVDGLPRLSVRISDRDDPLEVGRETVYEIVVSNEGSVADTNVQVQATLPPSLVPRQAGGPARYQIDGQRVSFEPLGRLDAGSQVVFRIGALARTAGDSRVRVQLTSSQLRVPVVREERTLVYKDGE